MGCTLSGLWASGPLNFFLTHGLISFNQYRTFRSSTSPWQADSERPCKHIRRSLHWGNHLHVQCQPNDPV